MRYIVNGGKKLSGTIANQGSKNEALAILAMAIFLQKKIVISNVPNISDIFDFLNIGKSLNLEYKFLSGKVYLDASNLKYGELNSTLVKKIRASIYYLPILASLNDEFAFYYPGGCNFGKRPIDFHLNLLKNVGFDYYENGEKIKFAGKQKYISKMFLPYPSFGTTINALLLGLNYKKEFKIIGGAKEPEIKKVLDFLKSCGYEISFSNGIIDIYGYKEKEIYSYEISYDRIVAASYLCLGAMCAENLKVKNCPLEDMQDFFEALDSGNIDYSIEENDVVINSQKYQGKNFYISRPYPGLSTDLVPCLISLFSVGNGIAFIEDKVYKGRKKYLEELKKMNANISIIDELVVVLGTDKILNNTIKAVDLRGGMACLLLAIKAPGKTIIEHDEIIKRGYENLVEKLNDIGVDIHEE